MMKFTEFERDSLIRILDLALESGMSITALADIPERFGVRFSRRAPKAIDIEIDKGGAAPAVMTVEGGDVGKVASHLAEKWLLPRVMGGFYHTPAEFAEQMAATCGLPWRVEGDTAFIEGAALHDKLFEFICEYNEGTGLVAFTPEDTGSGISITLLPLSLDTMRRAAALGDMIALAAFKRGRDCKEWSHAEPSPIRLAGLNGRVRATHMLYWRACHYWDGIPADLPDECVTGPSPKRMERLRKELGS